MEADPASLDRQITATQYADLAVQPGSRVLSDLRFDPRQHHLYVMTSTKVGGRSALLPWWGPEDVSERREGIPRRRRGGHRPVFLSVNAFPMSSLRPFFCSLPLLFVFVYCSCRFPRQFAVVARAAVSQWGAPCPPLRRATPIPAMINVRGVAACHPFVLLSCQSGLDGDRCRTRLLLDCGCGSRVWRWCWR